MDSRSLCQLHEIEKTILKIFLPGNKFPATSSYWLIRSAYANPLLFKNYCRSLKNLVAKKILGVYRDKNAKEPIYFLTQYGITIRNYLFPVFNLLDNVEYTTILVTPKKAAEETGFSITSIKKRRVYHLHYLTLYRKLYILKRVRIKDIQKEIPNYPLLTDIFELLHLIPEPPRKLIPIIERMNTGGSWLWPEIFFCLLGKGHYISPEDKGNKNKKQIKEKEVKDERVCLP
jgi:hypothetical protein